MSLRITTCAFTLCLLIASPAFGKSYHVHTSSSVHVSTDGSVTRTEEHVSEENGSNTTSLMRATTCTTVNGERTCVEESKTDDQPTSSAQIRTSAALEKNDDGLSWWHRWSDRIMNTLRLRQVASDSSEDKIEDLLNRAEARLAKRICRQFEGDERETCMEDAVESDGSIRMRLRAWIDRITH